MRALVIGLCLSLGVLLACEPKPQPPQSAPSAKAPPATKATPAHEAPAPAAPAATPASIGSATMTADGTIVLQLRATGPGPAIGDGLVRYAKGHPKYDEVLRHLGGLKPGETKPCPPFPD